MSSVYLSHETLSLLKCFFLPRCYYHCLRWIHPGPRVLCNMWCVWCYNCGAWWQLPIGGRPGKCVIPQDIKYLEYFSPSPRWLALSSLLDSSSSLALVIAVLTMSWMWPWMFCQKWSMLVLAPGVLMFSLVPPFSRLGFFWYPLPLAAASMLLSSLMLSSISSPSSSMSASSDSDLSEMSSCLSSSDL